MKPSEAITFFKEVPKNYAVVEITKDRKVFPGRRVNKGSLGYICEATQPPTVHLLTGNTLGVVAIPSTYLKKLGYYTEAEVAQIVRERS